MERRPTCHFVQVIFGCTRLKRDGMGSFGFPCFFMDRILQILLIFYIFPILGIKTLATCGQISYNTMVYAHPVKTRTLPKDIFERN